MKIFGLSRIKFPPNRIYLMLLAFVAVIFFIRCYVHVPSGDELLYQYVWEKDDPVYLWDSEHRFERKIDNVGDVIQTQILHYKLVNGRTLVHTVEQLFTGHELLFSIVNTGVFLLFVSLIVRFVSGNWRGTYLLWLSVFIALLYLFPFQSSLWTSVNYGLNYLWPSTMAVGMLMLWDKEDAGRLRSRCVLPVILLSFLFGWTHEGFVVGLAGGMFIYYCVHRNRFRGTALALAIPMWIAAVIMVFSPGNLLRFLFYDSDNSVPILSRISNGVDNMLHLYIWEILFWGSVVLICFGKWRMIKNFYCDNSRLVYVLIVAVCFSLVANTAPYSHAFVELLSLLLILRYLWGYCRITKTMSVCVSLILTFLFCTFQIILAKDTVTIYKFQKRILSEYIASPDGLVRYDKPDINCISEEGIRLWDPDSKMIKHLGDCFNNVYSKGEKEPYFMLPEDFKALAEPSGFFVEKNKFPGNAPVYKSEAGLWLWLDTTSLKANRKLVATYAPVSFFHNTDLALRIKFLLFPESYPDKEVLSMDTLKTLYGNSYRILPPPSRKVLRIDVDD